MKETMVNKPLSARAMYLMQNPGDLEKPKESVNEENNKKRKRDSMSPHVKKGTKISRIQQLKNRGNFVKKPRRENSFNQIKKQNFEKTSSVPSKVYQPNGKPNEPLIASNKKKNKKKNVVKKNNIVQESKIERIEKTTITENGIINEKQIKGKTKKNYKNLETPWKIEPKDALEIDAINKDSSKIDGDEAMKFIISPTKNSEFFQTYWEKKPLLIKRNNSNYYKGVFSTHDFDKILRNDNIQYTKNLDVTSYTDGERKTLNPEGRAMAPVVWDFYNEGCSLRLLNPQTFHRPVWRLLSSLQEKFGSFCGANVYLTPPDTQGFAPHWDDIEAFILQLEGKKRWRVYKPRNEEETLPRESSANLSQEEVSDPLMDVVLEAGDLLYFPRGYIHQGNTVGNEHSLHITVSSYQKTSWADFLEKMLPEALSVAAKEDVSFREGLPLNYLDYMGIVNSASGQNPKRNQFKQQVKKLLEKLIDYSPIDSAADKMGVGFIHDSLPPVINPDELRCTSFGGGERWSKKKLTVVNQVELEPDTYVRLIRSDCVRMVVEEDHVKLYYNLENSREYHEFEPQFIELQLVHAPVLEALIKMYPRYIVIEQFPLDTLEDKMELANGLWERGLLMTSHELISLGE